MEKSITKEEYLKYQEYRNSILSKKGQRSDLLDSLYALKRNLILLEQEYDLVQEDIDNTTNECQSYIEYLGTKYNLPTGLYNISEQEPHFITVAN